MPTMNRNILLKILIVLISITMFGFQDIPDVKSYKLDMDQEPILEGWVEIIVYAKYSWNAGTHFYNILEGPVQVFLPITSFDSRGRAKLSGQADTLGRTNASLSGVISQMGMWPVHWNFEGTLSPPPDCTLELAIDETWFPGINIACEPTGVVGCISEMWKPNYFPGVPVKIPFNQAYGESKPGLDGRFLTVIVYHLSLGNPEEYIGVGPVGCEHHTFLIPIIPPVQE